MKTQSKRSPIRVHHRTSEQRVLSPLRLVILVLLFTLLLLTLTYNTTLRITQKGIAQQEPQPPWSFTGVTAPFVRQSIRSLNILPWDLIGI